MQTFTLDTKEAGNFAWAAAQDAERVSNKWRSTYSVDERNRVLKAIDLLDCAYSCVESFINFRKGFATIKINGARVKDRVLRDQLEAYWESQGTVKKCETPQGTIYRFFRA